MDIVERLRSKKMERVGAGRTGREAAAEIERLRAECCDKALAWDKCQEHLKRAEAAEQERNRLREAWTHAKRSLPPDINLNEPWSLCIAIMDEALAEDSDAAE